MSSQPRVLLIDDEASDDLVPRDCKALLLRPQDDGFAQSFASELPRADIALLDQELAFNAELSLKAFDGTGLIGHIRSWARKSNTIVPPLVVYTSHDEAFAEELPSVGPPVPIGGTFVGKEALLAPALDVEWLISKEAEQALSQISSIAKASLSLASCAKNDKASFDEIVQFIALPVDQSWSVLARQNLARSRPPVGEPALSERYGTRGTAPVLRWLLHRVLPYPGLLVSDSYAAWTIGLELDSFRLVVDRKPDSEWARDLLSSMYQGPADDLFPRRWWSAGIEYAAWSIREKSQQHDCMTTLLTKLVGEDVRTLDGAEKVVVVDLDFKEAGLEEISRAYQIHPPGWPAEAIEPWMRRELVEREPSVLAMLDPDDRLRLDS